VVVNIIFKLIYKLDYDIIMNYLYVDSVTKSFGLKQVLTDIFISCKKGEIIGLLGRNGAGKSTLLKIIFGSISADSKFIRIGNKMIDGLYDNRNLINYLPQHSFLPNHLKVSQLISLFCNKSNADIINANAHIHPLVNKLTNQLSGGERRLVEIFLIVHSNADYILIDEPFNGIAPIFKEEIKCLIKEYSGSKGFIITDHDYRNIIDIATRTILMHDGGLEEIKQKDDLIFWNYIPENASL
jgi:ABC-type multidrug transport system ATPase subunit